MLPSISNQTIGGSIATGKNININDDDDDNDEFGCTCSCKILRVHYLILNTA